MARVLLLLPTETYRARDFLEAARALQAEVVVATDRRLAISSVLGDRAVSLNLDDPEASAHEIVELAKRDHLDAIVPVDDQGVVIAALAAKRLGLRHNPIESALAARDKAAMRHALGAAHIPQPDYRVATESSNFAALADSVGWPCVIKPLSLAASRGVIRADNRASAVAAAERARAISRAAGGDERLLVERYLPGAEVAVEGLLAGGSLEILAVFDKPDPLEGPYFEETLYVTPSRQPEAALGAITRTTAAAVAALGLVEGPVHAEVRVQGDRAAVLEVAARSIGGLCSRALRFGLGISLEELILRHALDLPLRHKGRPWRASGVMMIPIEGSGVLEAVKGRDEALAVPGVLGLSVTIPLGSAVEPLPEGDRYLGFLFASGEGPGEVEQALRTAHSCLQVVLRPQ
ncbi:MAG: ATP-grasp domain-containing protein [Actinobacteria bacterium]|nr:ATP-grasp domain-containing protein [Actinomycetota bacterium]